MNKFTLPEEHHMLLVLRSFLDFSCVHLSGLLLFDLEDFSKGSRSKLFDDLEAAIKDLLAFL